LSVRSVLHFLRRRNRGGPTVTDAEILRIAAQALAARGLAVAVGPTAIEPTRLDRRRSRWQVPRADEWPDDPNPTLSW
jgi:hypothetical protein